MAKIILIALSAAVVLFVLPTMLISLIIFNVLLVRQNKEKWSRECSWDDPEQEEMFAAGARWGKENEEFLREVSIHNDGFRLVGEYFDFGNKKAVIIIPGRMETCIYSYYFAEPFKKSGYNVLAVDNRSHGLSEGKFNTLGLREYNDIIAWAKFLNKQCGIETVFLHGICIGSATALYALTSENCPEFIKGMSADGMYVNFIESYKNHLIERNKPLFPFLAEFRLLIKLVSGKDPVKFSPINLMPKLKKPILFIYTKKDTYSVPEKGQLLFDTCTAPKKLVWFDKGIHSHVRINAVEKYDSTICEFLKEYIQ